MSRFYNAVQEANRYREIPELTPAWEDTAPLENEAADLESALGIASGESAASEVAAPWQIIEDELLGPPPVPQNGSLGVQTQTVIDKKAPLLTRAIDSYIVEYYRRLRTKIIQQQAVKPFRSLIVTSPNPQEGKTITAMNLALSFAMLPSFKVLVVDGDLRRGSLSKLLGLDGRPGFGNLIDGSAKLEDVILKSDDFPVNFMLRGNSQIPAGELLSPMQLRTQLQGMTDHFQLILVDSPPLNLITDTQLLANHCDAIMLVARAFTTTRKSLEKAAADLQSFRVIGTVLNGVGPQNLRRYRGYY